MYLAMDCMDKSRNDFFKPEFYKQYYIILNAII